MKYVIKAAAKRRVTKRDAFNALLRKQKFMPSFTCSLVTLAFCRRVLANEVAIPRMTQVSPIRLASPPPKRLLKVILLG